MISRSFWIIKPDHISYFNHSGLTALCEDNGWECKNVLSDFPIDWNLFNSNTNYVENPVKGSSCHKARLQIDNLMHNISVEKTNKFYQSLADLGLGRQIIGFFQLSEKK